jgi:hypothetical protein
VYPLPASVMTTELTVPVERLAVAAVSRSRRSGKTDGWRFGIARSGVYYRNRVYLVRQNGSSGACLCSCRRVRRAYDHGWSGCVATTLIGDSNRLNSACADADCGRCSSLHAVCIIGGTDDNVWSGYVTTTSIANGY